MQSGEDGNRNAANAPVSSSAPPRKKKIKKRNKEKHASSASAVVTGNSTNSSGRGNEEPTTRGGKSTEASAGILPLSTSSGVASSGNGVASSSSNIHAAASNNGSGNNSKKNRKQGRRKEHQNNAGSVNNNTSSSRVGSSSSGAATEQVPLFDPAQQAVNDQMRRALEEDQYSAIGSIVDAADSEEEDLFLYRGQPVRLDRAAMIQTAKKMNYYYWYPHQQGQKKSLSAAQRQMISPDFMSQVINGGDDDADDFDDDDDMHDEYDHRGNNSLAKESGRSKKKRKKDMGGHGMHMSGSSGVSDITSSVNTGGVGGVSASSGHAGSNNQIRENAVDFLDPDDDLDRDGGSIFGQTTGATNSTWVECDKCKKWRRLRGVVDEKKLPPKWFCSMNRNDPERARCSAPEEDYDAQQTPESAAEARTRKHLRVWVRRLQCQEAYEARQPTLTRGKKRAAANSMKDPYEWVRCCNPSCGKWRAVLRFMDAKTSVMDRSASSANAGKKEWYCVMNTWDEKMASCAAPQENLPAIGCPSWVLQDEETEKE